MRDLADVEITFVETFDDALDFKRWLGERRDWLGYDIETEGLMPGRHAIRLAQFGDTERGFAFPYPDWRGVVKEALETYEGPTVAHNLLFEQKMSTFDGIRLKQRWLHDTLIMTHLDDPISSARLKASAARNVDQRALAGEARLKKMMQTHGWDWATVPVDLPEYWMYGVMDTVLTARLAATLWPKVSRYRRVYEVELGCIHVLRDAELKGVQLDMDYCARTTQELEDRREQLRPLIPDDLKNPRSDAQIVSFLAGRGYQFWKKTEKGNWSVDDDVLQDAVDSGIQAAAPVKEYRKCSWLLSNYFKPFADLNIGGVLHASVKPVGARTGRMSIEKPALQTLPRTPMVRSAIVPREGHKLVLADFSGAEMRVMASFANDENMIAAYARGEDIHGYTASQIWQKPQDQVRREERQVAKNAGFAKIYYAGVETFARTAKIPSAQAQQFMESWDRLFPGIKPYQDSVIARVHETAGGGEFGHVETILGRRLLVERKKAYKGINYETQSSATADVLKLKLIELANAGLGPFIRLAIHDEAMFEVPDDIVPDVCDVIRRVMPERHLFRVPLEIEVGVYDCWGDKYRGG